MRTDSKRAKILEVASSRGVIRAEDVRPFGVSPSSVYDLARDGALDQIGKGLFTLPDFPFTERHTLVEVAVCVPEAVICLLSALQFHGLGTQLPDRVWIALPRGSRRPTKCPVAIQLVRMSAAPFETGIERHTAEGVELKVYFVAKTIADCFKFRSLVGTDVCVEALNDALRQRKVTPAELYDVSRVDHVWEIIRPYLEALQCRSI